MSRIRGPSFVLELPLRVDGGAEHALNVRFEAGRQLYNACLGEALKRLERMRRSPAWIAASGLLRGQERASAFREANRALGFTEYDLHAFAVSCKNACFIGGHLDVHSVQKIASRAFAAARQHALGVRGRPRFKGRIHALDSVEGKSNAAGIRWRGDRVEWKGLVLRPLFDRKDKHGVQTFALQCPVKYVRLVRRTLRGRVRWYVQLVLAGRPKWKDKRRIGRETVGLDIGPSTVAVAGETGARLERFCDGVEYPRRRIRLLQRAMDRSLRATNPGHYRPDGTVRPGPKRWVRSARYRRLQTGVRETQRRMAAARKTAHGALANRVIALGKDIKTERLSYRAFQKRYGRSIRDRAPASFLSLLARKAESAGGKLIEFSTYKTRLSQTCHCGARAKKPLSQRWHECACGVGPVQRDLYSAFLARFVEKDRLDIRRAREAWPVAEPLLGNAMSRLRQSASGRPRPSSFGLGRRRSGSHSEGRLSGGEAAASPSGHPRKTAGITAGTPRI